MLWWIIKAFLTVVSGIWVVFCGVVLVAIYIIAWVFCKKWADIVSDYSDNIAMKNLLPTWTSKVTFLPQVLFEKNKIGEEE
jgi:hypothetical protein